MKNEQIGAAAREIPVPPGGGSWRFDEAAWAWVANDLKPGADVADAAPADQVVPHTTEQEQ